MEFSIRPATLEDCEDMARLVRELMEYHELKNCVTQTDLEQDGFSENPFFHVFIAEVPEEHKSKDGYTKIGCALYFYSYSTLIGKAIYLDVLHVMAEFSGKGVGKALLKKVAQEGVAAGCKELNFIMLDRNKTASDFYFSQGCCDVTTTLGFHFMSCSKEPLKHLAKS